MYNFGWIVSNRVPSSVRTWGGWIENDITEDSIVLFVTGNPGITDFYKKFLSSLHQLVKIPVWVICHAGSQLPPNSENMVLPSIKSNPDLYNLNGQIKHKEEFIKNYIPENKKIYLIGHSIGGKICVELMKKPSIAKRVKQVHLVCPTLENIAETRNGKIFRHFLGRIAPFLVTLAWLFTFLPFRIRAFCVYIIAFFYTLSLSLESCCISGLLKLFTPKALQGVFLLAHDEMVNVKELDHEVYEKFFPKIYAYYGQNDNWAPLYQYENLKKHHPNIDFTILESKMTHSFVFKSSEAAAAILAENINKK